MSAVIHYSVFTTENKNSCHVLKEIKDLEEFRAKNQRLQKVETEVCTGVVELCWLFFPTHLLLCAAVGRPIAALLFSPLPADISDCLLAVPA